MTAPRFEAPGPATLAAALAMLLALAFVRCGPPQPGVTTPASSVAAPVAATTTAGPPTAPSSAPSTPPSAEPPAPAAPEPKRPVVVAALGDSLTDAKSGGGKYLDYLAKRCPESRIDNYGKGGDMVNQMRKRFERDVLTSGTAYTHLILFGGVNDLYSDLTAGRTPAKIEADLAAIYQAARARGWKVVALTVAPWGGFTKYYNDKRAAATKELNTWIRAQLTEAKISAVVDAFALLDCKDKLCPEYAGTLRDGLHFGPAGHEKLGAALHEQVFASCR